MTGYTNGQIVTLVGGTFTTAATVSLTVAPGNTSLGNVFAVGGTVTGYTNGQIVTLVGGTFTTAATVSLTVVSGSVTAATVVNAGTYTRRPPCR